MSFSDGLQKQADLLNAALAGGKKLLGQGAQLAKNPLVRGGAAVGALGGAAGGALAKDENGNRGGVGGALKGAVTGGLAGGALGAGKAKLDAYRRVKPLALPAPATSGS